MRREPRTSNFIVLPSKPRKSSRVSIKRRMKRTRRDLKTKSSSLKRTLKRGLRPSMRPSRSLSTILERREWRASNWKTKLVPFKIMSTNVSRS